MFTNKALKSLIIPLVIQVLIMLVGMVDTMMVSHAGEAAISGVALADMIDYLIITIFQRWQPGVRSLYLSIWAANKQILTHTIVAP